LSDLAKYSVTRSARGVSATAELLVVGRAWRDLILYAWLLVRGLSVDAIGPYVE